MDVDFSQVGRNVAVPIGEQPTRRPETDDNGQTQAVNNDAESSQVSVSAADNRDSTRSDSRSIETAVAEISEFVQAQNRQLQFSIDEGSNRSVVKVTDSESGDVIRQIPSEEVLALSERIRALQSDVGAAVGVLFNRQV